MASLDLLGSTLQGRKWCLIYFLFYWVDCERGREVGVSNFNMKFWIVKQGNMNEKGPAGIKVGRIFGPNSVCSCLGTLVVHMWKETTTFALILALYRHDAVVCRRVNWKGLTAYNVTSPLNIWTRFGVWLARTLCGPPSKEKSCVVSIIYSIEWTAKGGGGRLKRVLYQKCAYGPYC